MRYTYSFIYVVRVLFHIQYSELNRLGAALMLRCHLQSTAWIWIFLEIILYLVIVSLLC